MCNLHGLRYTIHSVTICVNLEVLMMALGAESSGLIH
jgi:hypothetical protein